MTGMGDMHRAIFRPPAEKLPPMAVIKISFELDQDNFDKLQVIHESIKRILSGTTSGPMTMSADPEATADDASDAVAQREQVRKVAQMEMRRHIIGRLRQRASEYPPKAIVPSPGEALTRMANELEPTDANADISATVRGGMFVDAIEAERRWVIAYLAECTNGETVPTLSQIIDTLEARWGL